MKWTRYLYKLWFPNAKLEDTARMGLLWKTEERLVPALAYFKLCSGRVTHGNIGKVEGTKPSSLCPKCL